MKGHFNLRKRVEFADTDAAGIMHFASFFRFMEVCEHSFLRSVGFSAHPPGAEAGGGESSTDVGWPRVHASCDYKKALKFEEEVEIELGIEELGTRTVSYQFHFWKNPDDQEKRTLAATGKFTVVCVCWGEENEGMKAVEIPSQIRKKLEEIRTA